MGVTGWQRQEQRHQEDLQRLQGFRPIDDTFMRGLFKENIPLAEFVLRIITGKQDLILIKCETQADFKRVTGARSICLDAYATDSTGKKYDIEVQRSDNGADPHRARYHSSMMDVENLDEKQDYRELPDTYVIFITENDYYNADDMNFEILAEKTRYLKENPKGVKEMCKVMEDLREESFAEGRREQAQMTARNLSVQGLSVEQIAQAVGFSVEAVKEWLAQKDV